LILNYDDFETKNFVSSNEIDSANKSSKLTSESKNPTNQINQSDDIVKVTQMISQENKNKEDDVV